MDYREILDFIILKFCKDDLDNPIDWGKETRLAKTLLKTYPFSFLESYELGFKVKSLLWFLGKGKVDLIKKYQEYNKSLLTEPKKEEIKLEEKPVIEITNNKRVANFLDL